MIAAAVIAAAGIWFALTRNSLDLASNNSKRTWQPVVMMPWVKYGYDFTAAPDARLDSWFARLESDGVKGVGWFLFADGRGSLEFDPAGNVTGLQSKFLDSYRALLKLAARHRLKLVWIVTDFELGMPAEGRMFGHADLLEEAPKRASFIKNALTPVLQEDASQIAGWIVMNEPEHLLRSGYVSESAIRAFVGETAAAIRRYRPTQHIGLADADLASMMEFADIRALDFLVFHHYSSLLPPPAAFLGQKKPVYIGEFNLNYPPGTDLEDFVRTAKGLGYAGVWPWSLRDRLDETGIKAAETDPQFDLTSAYAAAMQQRQIRPNERELRRVLALSSDRRIAELAGKPEFHRSEIQLNANWAAAMEKASKLHDLRLATERVRMHTYLQRETTAELNWLHNLQRLLGDKLDERSRP